MPPYTMRVEHTDGSADTPELNFVRHIDEFGRMPQLELGTDRNAANAAALDEGDDEVYLMDAGSKDAGGILRDTRTRRAKTKLLMDGFEQYAIDAPRGPANETLVGTDQEIVRGAVDDVPQLTKGTINQTATDLQIIGNYASPARIIRQVRNVTGGEMRYNVDKSVDYLAEIGADKTATTLRPSNGNLHVLKADRRTGERATHVKCLGSGSGDAQKQKEAIASSYNATNDREVWATYEDTEIVDPDTLANVCQIVADEMYGGRTEVVGWVYGEAVGVGDRFHVVYPPRNIDANLSAIKVVRIIDVHGERYKVTFANQRFVESERDKKIREDVGKYVRGEIRSGLGQYDDVGNAPAYQSEAGYLIWITGDGPTTPSGVYAFRPGEGYNRVVDTDDLRWHQYEYGDLSDGDTVFSSNQTVSGVKFYNTFEVQSGVTLSVPSGENLIVYADDAIINGTIDGSGADGGGGAGGDAALEIVGDPSIETPGGDGTAGIDGTYAPSAAGGAGGAGGNKGHEVSGGEGGDGGSAPDSEEARLWPRTGMPTPELMPALDLHTRAGAAGGGGGGEANTTSTDASGGDGSVPGAGGGGAIKDGEVTGGDGGEGGALIVIMAESFSGTGTIDASGGGGTFGTNTQGNPENNYGGGGGGGSGGAIIVISDDISDWASQTHDVSEGNGVNPAADANGIKGGSGQEGEVGFVYGFDRDTRTVFS